MAGAKRENCRGAGAGVREWSLLMWSRKIFLHEEWSHIHIQINVTCLPSWWLMVCIHVNWGRMSSAFILVSECSSSAVISALLHNTPSHRALSLKWSGCESEESSRNCPQACRIEMGCHWNCLLNWLHVWVYSFWWSVNSLIIKTNDTILQATYQKWFKNKTGIPSNKKEMWVSCNYDTLFGTC